jgi:uncharacterized membrane-anchored protein
MKTETNEAAVLKAQLNKVTALLEQLIAIQLYRGGASQVEIAQNMKFSVGKVNGLVKGMKAVQEHHGKK